MSTFTPGDPVFAGNTRATFVKALPDGKAVISVGYDTRIVDPVSLRKAE